MDQEPKHLPPSNANEMFAVHCLHTSFVLLSPPYPYELGKVCHKGPASLGATNEHA